MKTPRPDPESLRDPFDGVELAAADWLARQEFGLTRRETTELQHWLEQDPRHARVFAELEKTAEVVERHPQALAETAGGCAVGSRDKVASVRRPRRAQSASWAALAAALVIGLFQMAWRRPFNVANEYQLAASTEIGAMRSLTLPDGSSVRLNTDSALDVRYSPGERRVRLTRGEASFSVAKEASRPFFVEALGVAVRAVGTEFVVRLRPEAIDILVTEGSVRVENAAAHNLLPVRNLSSTSSDRPTAEPLLRAGEQVIVPVAKAVPVVAAVVAEVAPEQIARAMAWQKRQLMFESTPLAEVVVEFNRYIRHRLVIEDATLGRQKFGGTFHPERYETLISLLEQSFDVVAERRGDTTYLRRRREP